MTALIANGVPEWVTPEMARQMADQVVMACAEAGYPEVRATPRSLFGPTINYEFVGAPDEVLLKAGALVRQRWLEDRGRSR